MEMTPLAEKVAKRCIVQEDVGVLEFMIEAPLHPLHAEQNTIAVLIPGHHQNGSPCSPATAAAGQQL